MTSDGSSGDGSLSSWLYSVVTLTVGISGDSTTVFLTIFFFLDSFFLESSAPYSSSAVSFSGSRSASVTSTVSTVLLSVLPPALDEISRALFTVFFTVFLPRVDVVVVCCSCCCVVTLLTSSGTVSPSESYITACSSFSALLATLTFFWEADSLSTKICSSSADFDSCSSRTISDNWVSKVSSGS